MKSFIALGDVFWFAGGFAACYFSGVIVSWAKGQFSKAKDEIKAKL